MCTYPVQPICTFSCTSVFFFINIYYSQYTVLHILSHCTSYSFYFYYLSPFSFSPIFIYIYSLVLCFIVFILFSILLLLLLFFFSLHFPLSGPVPSYISLLIIPCIIVYVTNNKEPWPWTSCSTSQTQSKSRISEWPKLIYYALFTRKSSSFFTSLHMRSSFQFWFSNRSSVYMSSCSNLQRNKPPLTIWYTFLSDLGNSIRLKCLHVTFLFRLCF